jgi:hypothetical protein
VGAITRISISGACSTRGATKRVPEGGMCSSLAFCYRAWHKVWLEGFERISSLEGPVLCERLLGLYVKLGGKPVDGVDDMIRTFSV